MGEVKAHQLRTDNRRLRVGGVVPLYIEQGGQAQPTAPVRDAADYIDALKILMLGYAKAGVFPLEGVPAAEPLGSGTINFFECPLDVVMRHANRADIQSSLSRLRNVSNGFGHVTKLR